MTTTSNNEVWNACVEEVMGATGLPRKEAVALMKTAREQYGIRARKYCELKLYTVAVEEQEAVYQAHLKEKEKKKKRKKAWNRSVAKVMEATGLPREEAVEKLKSARERFGIKHREYCKAKLYEAEDDLVGEAYEAYLKRLQRARQKKELWRACVAEVVEATKVSEAEAKEMMRTARASYGIKAKDYCAYKMYRIPVAEQAARYQIALLQEETKRQNIRNCYQATMEYKGCSREEAKAEVRQRRKRLGIKHGQYARYAVWTLPEDGLEEAYEAAVAQARIEAQEAHYAERHEEAEHAIEAVMKRKGWSREETLEQMDKAKQVTGCSYTEYFKKEYFMFNLYDMTEEEQKKVALYHHSKDIAQKYMVDRRFARILKNKETTNIYFADILNRAWCISTKVDLDAFKDCFKDCKRIIFKPVRGHKGEGVKAFDLTPENMEAVYAEIAADEEGIVEEYVVQHPALSAMAPSSVNTLRVVTVSVNDQPVTPDGEHMAILYTTLRIGGGTSVVDNFHGGGMCAVADIETGRLITNGANMEGEVFEKHPYSGLTIKGFQIPMYQEALDMVRKACAKELSQGYIGWDVAITEKGPVLIEANMIPGIVLLSTPMGPDKQDSLSILKPFM